MFLLLVVAGAVVLAAQVLEVRNELTAAKSGMGDVRAALVRADVGAARHALTEVRSHTSRAASTSRSVVWTAAAALPFLGDDLRTIRTVAVGVEGITTSALPALLDSVELLEPSRLRSHADSIDVSLVEAAADPLAKANEAVVYTRGQVDLLPRDGLVSPVAQGLAEFEADLEQLSAGLGAASSGARLLPAMLGSREPRTYFLAIQTPAEARGTGGLLGAYGLLKADRGRIQVVRLGSNGELRNPGRMPVDLGQDYRSLYGEDPALWVNANLSPHFPYASKLWLEMWRRQHGQSLDGVIAVDPLVLQHLLQAVGPVPLEGGRLAKGETITAENVVDLTLREIYSRYPDSNDGGRRDAHLQEVAAAVVGRLFSGNVDARALAAALGRATAENRLVLYSARRDEQERLEHLSVAGVLPQHEGPFFAPVVVNGGGNKLDYYLDRRIEYGRRCDGSGTTARITLTNAAPPGPLPPYAVGEENPSARMRLLFWGHLSHGASLRRAERDGRQLYVSVGRERGRPVIGTTVELARGASTTLSFDLAENVPVQAPFKIWEQALVRKATLVTNSQQCW